ncbi:MAG: hypothetical protein WC978_00210 [bacterium]
MTVPMPSPEDLELFRDLFIGARNAVVINGKYFPGDRTADFYSDDLLIQHFTGEVSVEAFILKHETWCRPNRFAVSIHSTIPAIVKAVIAELAKFSIKAYVERSHSRYVVRGYFEGSESQWRSFPAHNYALLPAWYAVERVRLQPAAGASFVIRPEISREFVSPLGILGGCIELPFAPCGGRFVDPATMEPYGDQWKFLRSIVRNSAETLRDTRDVFTAAWAREKDYDAPPASPYEGLAYAKLRAGHDEIYFAPWRRPDPGPYDIRRAYLQLGGLLREVLQVLKVRDLPAVRYDIEQSIRELENTLPGGESPDVVLTMDEALAHIHRAIDGLLQDQGLPPHSSLDFATANQTA